MANRLKTNGIMNENYEFNARIQIVLGMIENLCFRTLDGTWKQLLWYLHYKITFLFEKIDQF